MYPLLQRLSGPVLLIPVPSLAPPEALARSLGSLLLFLCSGNPKKKLMKSFYLINLKRPS